MNHSVKIGDVALQLFLSVSANAIQFFCPLRARPLLTPLTAERRRNRRKERKDERNRCACFTFHLLYALALYSSPLLCLSALLSSLLPLPLANFCATPDESTLTIPTVTEGRNASCIIAFASETKQHTTAFLIHPHRSTCNRSHSRLRATSQSAAVQKRQF